MGIETQANIYIINKLISISKQIRVFQNNKLNILFIKQIQMKPYPSQIPELTSRNKEFQIEIPRQIKEAGKLLGASYLQFGTSECVAAYNDRFLYFMEIVDGIAVRYSTFAIQNIVSIVSIIRGYMLITNSEKKIWLLQVKKAQTKEEGTTNKEEKSLQVQCFLKQTLFNSYFLRQVTTNMIELQIYAHNPGQTTKNLLIYQFTINQKVGVMGYTLDKSYKIVKLSRKQLYGSKIFYDPSQNLIVRFKNFSDTQMQTKKISQEDSPLHVFPICKIQEYYGINKNYDLFNLQIPNTRKNIAELKNLDLKNSQSHLNYLLVRTNLDKVCLMVFQEGMECRVLGFVEKNYYWHISTGGRLVGVSHDQMKIKITREFNTRISQLSVVSGDVLINKSDDQSTCSLPQKSLQVNGKMEDENKKQSGKSENIEIKESNSSQICKKQEQKEVRQDSQIKKLNSNFKPSKIISRKIITSQKTESHNEQIQKDKTEQLHSGEIKIAKIQRKVDKQEAHQQKKQPEKKVSDSQQIQNNQVQKNQQEEADPVEKKTDSMINKEKQLEGQMIYTKQKQKNEKNQQLNDKQSKVVDKNINSQKGTFINKMKIPNVPYDKIFGNPGRPQTQSSIFGPKDPYSIFPSPFMKKPSADSSQIDKPVSQVNQMHLQTKSEIKILKVQQQSEQTKRLLEQKIKQGVEDFTNKLSSLERQTEKVWEGLDARVGDLTLKISEILPQIKLLEPVFHEKIENQIKTKTEYHLNDYFSKNLTNKINSYFKGVFLQSKDVYDASLNFYINRKRDSIISLQSHFEEQQHLVNQIRLISANMLTCVHTSIQEGQEVHACLERKWDKMLDGIEEKLDKNTHSLQNINSNSSADKKEMIQQSLKEIKEELENRRRMRQEKIERQKEREKMKLKQKQKMKEGQKKPLKLKKANSSGKSKAIAMQLMGLELKKGTKGRNKRKGEQKLVAPSSYERYYSQI